MSTNFISSIANISTFQKETNTQTKKLLLKINLYDLIIFFIYIKKEKNIISVINKKSNITFINIKKYIYKKK